jgi:hypothetical protein
MNDMTMDGVAAASQSAGQALGSALAHAIACGELLIEAKRQVKHGEWRPWIEANCKVPARTARHYMALARRRKRLCDQNGNVLPLSVHDALHIMRELSGAPHSWPYDPDEMTEFPSFGEPYVPLTEADIQARRQARREARQGRWRVQNWRDFGALLETALMLGQWDNPPKPRHVAKAAKTGRTPGLTAESLRAVIAILTRYAEALEADSVGPPAPSPAPRP